MTKAAELAKMGEVLDNSQIGRKNITINGAMQVAQRATSATGLGANSGYFTLDRFDMTTGNTAGRYTASQSTVTDLEGFSNALKIECTTADTSVAAGEFFIIQNHNEGLNLQQLKASSTSTRAFTLSFYAKSNASRAIASEVLLTNGTNRQMSKLHTIGTSWARYTMTVPAASSTQIDNDNSNEMQVNFWLHAGSTYSSGTINDDALDSYADSARAGGIGSIFASTNNTLEITGVQLEVGSQATPFEHRSFGEELALCQRYFLLYADGSELIGGGGYQSSTFPDVAVIFPIEMRADPTLVQTSGSDYYGITTHNAAPVNFDDFTVAYTSSPRSQLLYPNENVSGTQGSYARFFCNSSGRISFSAEL